MALVSGSQDRPPSTSSTGMASTVESIDRALQILQLLDSSGLEGLQLAEISRRLGFTKATTHRALSTLRVRNFIAQNDDGNYRLGSAAINLGAGMISYNNLAATVHAALVGLCNEVHELVHLGVLDGTDIRYLDKVEPQRAIRVWSTIGGRVPAAISAMGRAILAFRDTSSTALIPYTEALSAHPTACHDNIHAKIIEAHERGWALEYEENEPGIACLGVPLLAHGTAIAAISVTAPSARMTPSRLTEIYDAMTRVLPPLLPAGMTVSRIESSD